MRRAPRGSRAGPAGERREGHRRARRRDARCTPSRPSGCSSPRAGWRLKDGVYRPGRRPDEPRGARDPHRPHRVPARRPRPRRPGARVRCRRPRPELHAGRACRPSPASTSRDARAAPAGARPARAADARGRPAVPGARPVRLRPGAHPRGRLQHARARGSQGPPPRRGPVLRVASARTSSPGRLPATTSPPTRTRGRSGGRRARRSRHGSRSRPPPSERRRSAHRTRR